MCGFILGLVRLPGWVCRGVSRGPVESGCTAAMQPPYGASPWDGAELPDGAMPSVGAETLVYGRL
jgi:hypothetical protein